MCPLHRVNPHQRCYAAGSRKGLEAVGIVDHTYRNEAVIKSAASAASLARLR